MALKKTAKKTVKKKTAKKAVKKTTGKKTGARTASKKKGPVKKKAKGEKPKSKVKTKAKGKSRPGKGGRAAVKGAAPESSVAQAAVAASVPPLAEDDFEKVVAAHHLLLSRDYAGAIEACEKILDANPQTPEALHILGLCSLAYGDQGRALALIEHAHEIDPDCRDYADALSYIYTRVGKLTDGLYYAKLSEALAPHPKIPGLTPAGLRDYGATLESASDPGHYLAAMKSFTNRDFYGAIAHCDKELRLNRNNGDAYHLLGCALLETGHYARSVSSFHAAIHLNPESGLSRAYLGEALYKLGRHAEARVVQEDACRLEPENAEVVSCVLRCLSYVDGADKKPHQKVASGISASRNGAKQKGRVPGRKIRIGYISDSFYSGHYSPLIEPLLRYYDRHNFDIYCYSTNSFKDVVTARCENYVSVWRNIFDFDTEVIAQIIERDEIDILVDLCFEDRSQAINVFAMKATARQLSWLGRSNVPGLPGMTDYLTDNVLSEQDAACNIAKMTPHILPGLLQIDPLPPHVTAGDSPFIEKGAVTLGGTADLALLTPDVVRLWADILRAYPFAELHLGLTQRRIRDVQLRIMDMFAHFGVMERVSFQEAPSGEGRAAPREDLYIDFFRTVDVLLDTPGVNCADAIPTALWMGVPVVTLRGNRRSGAIGASMLTSAGKPEWIAATDKEYMNAVGDVISNPEALRQTRETLQEDVSKSSLFTPWNGVRAIEVVYARLIGA